MTATISQELKRNPYTYSINFKNFPKISQNHSIVQHTGKECLPTTANR